MENLIFTSQENEILTEIYRRLNTFNKGDLNAKLMLLETLHKVKSLKDKKIIKCVTPETARALNWYELTDSGKIFFADHIQKISEDENLQIFEGRKVIDFNQEPQDRATIKKALQLIYDLSEKYQFNGILTEVLKITEEKNIEILM